MNTAYTFVTLRYVHDVVTGEFANVGVVLYSPESRYLEARFCNSYERLNALFIKIDHSHFRNLIRYLGNRFTELSVDLREELNLTPTQDIETLVRKILPADDSSLQWSTVGGGFTQDLQTTVVNLYARLVERYIRSGITQRRSDEDILKPFRAKLEKKKVSGQVREKLIETRDYQYEFHNAWKNSVWHLYEPISFDLMDPGSIVEKANRWLGRGVALNESTEKFKIHFLLGEPKQPGTEKAFKSAQHLLEKIPAKIELIKESELESFAESVAMDIANHLS